MIFEKILQAGMTKRQGILLIRPQSREPLVLQDLEHLLVIRMSARQWTRDHTAFLETENSVRRDPTAAVFVADYPFQAPFEHVEDRSKMAGANVKLSKLFYEFELIRHPCLSWISNAPGPLHYSAYASEIRAKVAQTGSDPLSFSIDVVHLANLLRLLSRICLVDAQGVHPNPAEHVSCRYSRNHITANRTGPEVFQSCQ